MKQLTAYDATGTTPTPIENWPVIDAGATSTPRKYVLRNTGDEELLGLVLDVTAIPGNDGDDMARFGIDPTGTADPEDVELGVVPLALGDMAPLDERALIVNWVVPAGSPALVGQRQFRITVRET